MLFVVGESEVERVHEPKVWFVHIYLTKCGFNYEHITVALINTTNSVQTENRGEENWPEALQNFLRQLSVPKRRGLDFSVTH